MRQEQERQEQERQEGVRKMRETLEKERLERELEQERQEMPQQEMLQQEMAQQQEPTRAGRRDSDTSRLASRQRESLRASAAGRRPCRTPSSSLTARSRRTSRTARSLCR